LNGARQAALDIFGQPLNVTNAPIVSAGGRRVGDHTNPILQPWAAEVSCRFPRGLAFCAIRQ
jgi:hypothetical protein